MKGKLYLIPRGLSTLGGHLELSSDSQETLRTITVFFIENQRDAEKFLFPILGSAALSQLHFEILNKHTPLAEIHGMLGSILQGHNAGVISEAGYPCIADPGSGLVTAAHRMGIEVCPLSGSSSLILALAASGLSGQQFRFLGYLPKEREARIKKLKEIEKNIVRYRETQIFIETPFRNNHLIEDCLASLDQSTCLCVAVALLSPAQRIVSAPISDWQALPWRPDKQPAVFLLGLPYYAGNSPQPHES